jgi:hypothetical protein
LLIRCGQHLFLDCLELFHFLADPGDLLFQMRSLGGQRLAWLLPVCGAGLAQIAGHALLKLLAPPLYLVACEVPVAVIDGFEFATIDGDAGFGQKTKLAAQLDKAGADLADSKAVVFAEIGDDLIVGDKPPQKPHDFEIAASLAFKAAAGVNLIEITVDVELQQNGRMIGRQAGSSGRNPIEAKPGQIERLHKRIDRANWIAPRDKIIKALRDQRCLTPIGSRDKPLHHHPPAAIARIVSDSAFSRSQDPVRTSPEPAIFAIHIAISCTYDGDHAATGV